MAQFIRNLFQPQSPNLSELLSSYSVRPSLSELLAPYTWRH
jgi:hypothetical protein